MHHHEYAALKQCERARRPHHAKARGSPDHRQEQHIEEPHMILLVLQEHPADAGHHHGHLQPGLGRAQTLRELRAPFGAEQHQHQGCGHQDADAVAGEKAPCAAEITICGADAERHQHAHVGDAAQQHAHQRHADQTRHVTPRVHVDTHAKAACQQIRHRGITRRQHRTGQQHHDHGPRRGRQGKFTPQRRQKNQRHVAHAAKHQQHDGDRGFGIKRGDAKARGKYVRNPI